MKPQDRKEYSRATSEISIIPDKGNFQRFKANYSESSVNFHICGHTIVSFSFRYYRLVIEDREVEEQIRDNFQKIDATLRLRKVTFLNYKLLVYGEFPFQFLNHLGW